MAFNQTPSLPQDMAYGRRTIDAINAAIRGKTNNRGEFTLDDGVGTTTLSDEKIGADSVIVLMPMSANAAAALPFLYFDTPTRGSVDVNHDVSVMTDRTFRYAVIG